MNGGPPHWIPTETGPRLGDPLFLSKTRARGVAEGRAGARAGGWERPSSGVQIIFTSATSGWTLTGREARRASRCPGQVRDRGSVGRALPKPGASACAWTSRPPPGASVPRLQALPLGVPRPRTAPGRHRLVLRSVHRAVCGSTRCRSTPQQGHSRARSGRRSGLTVPGQAVWPQVSSRSASRPAVQALRPRALSRQRGKPPRLSLLWGPQHVHGGSWWAL